MKQCNFCNWSIPDKESFYVVRVTKRFTINGEDITEAWKDQRVICQRCYDKRPTISIEGTTYAL